MSYILENIVTGWTVIDNIDHGVFDACQQRVDLCGYACCKFGKLGNWIKALPGEAEEARKRGLSFAHLDLQSEDETGAAFICNRPCKAGEFKSIDCAIYPLFIANETATQFVIADHRKCPIPSDRLIGHARHAQAIGFQWEANHPGTLKAMAAAAKAFIAYQPFPWEIGLNGDVRRLTEDETIAITPNDTLPDDYVPDWTPTGRFEGVDVTIYGAKRTPEDTPLIAVSDIQRMKK